MILLLLFAEAAPCPSTCKWPPIPTQCYACLLRKGRTCNLTKTKAAVFNHKTCKTSLVFAGEAVEQIDR